MKQHRNHGRRATGPGAVLPVDGLVSTSNRWMQQRLGDQALDQPKGDAYETRRVEGSLFLRGADDTHAISGDDIDQGALGDCYLLAALHAVAEADPSFIEDRITDLGGGRYRVQLDIGGYERRVTVDSVFPFNGDSPAYAGIGDETGGDRELWPMIIEKAYAQFRGGYDDIEGGSSGSAVRMMTRYPFYTYDPSDMRLHEITALIELCKSNKYPITAGTVHSVSGRNKEAFERHDGLVAGHAYSIHGIDGHDVVLYNPWGRYTELNIYWFQQYFREVRVNVPRGTERPAP